MFRCNKCGEITPKWHRVCPVCSTENTLKKQDLLSGLDTVEKLPSPDLEHLPSGFPIFDRVFNGGFLQSFVYYFYAGKGTGKTTFLLQVCSFLSSHGKSVVYFSFDESVDGIKKKCCLYALNGSLPYFVSENSPGIIERTVQEYTPEFVVIDSLQSLANYNSAEITGILYHIRKEAQKRGFALVVIGEERKDRTDYLGSASIGHIVDVPVKMVLGPDDEVIISTPQKNRDTDDRTSRCFFRRTPAGLVEIPESATGYLFRHREKEVIGLAAFVTKDGDEFSEDEVTAVLDAGTKKCSLTIAGMTTARTKNLLAVLRSTFTFTSGSLAIRANRTEKMLPDAELACMVAAMSLVFAKPVPVDTVFIGGVDNRGYLMPVNGMEERVKRAQARGYKRVIGPKANGIQAAMWEEAETLEGVLKTLGVVV